MAGGHFSERRNNKEDMKSKTAEDAGGFLSGYEKLFRLEMQDDPATELDVILRLRIKLRTHVVAFGSERDARAITKIYSCASLQRKSVLATDRDLRIHVQTTH